MNSQGKFVLILTILIVIFLIGGGVIGFLYWQNSQTEDVEVETKTTVNTSTETNQTVTSNINVGEEAVEETELKEIDEEDFIQQLAKSFAERYGSFSNQNDYENLLDLKIYMTKKMEQEVDDFVAASKEENKDNEVYYGITTKVLSLKKLSLEGDEASYSVSCQRKESKGLEGGNKTYTQTAKIEFKKVDGQWKVHSFTWL